jgi:hypothetical protein
MIVTQEIDLPLMFEKVSRSDVNSAKMTAGIMISFFFFCVYWLLSLTVGDAEVRSMPISDKVASLDGHKIYVCLVAFSPNWQHAWSSFLEVRGSVDSVELILLKRFFEFEF